MPSFDSHWAFDCYSKAALPAEDIGKGDDALTNVIVDVRLRFGSKNCLQILGS